MVRENGFGPNTEDIAFSNKGKEEDPEKIPPNYARAMDVRAAGLGTGYEPKSTRPKTDNSIGRPVIQEERAGLDERGKQNIKIVDKLKDNPNLKKDNSNLNEIIEGLLLKEGIEPEEGRVDNIASKFLTLTRLIEITPNMEKLGGLLKEKEAAEEKKGAAEEALARAQVFADEDPQRILDMKKRITDMKKRITDIQNQINQITEKK